MLLVIRDLLHMESIKLDIGQTIKYRKRISRIVYCISYNFRFSSTLPKPKNDYNKNDSIELAVSQLMKCPCLSIESIDSGKKISLCGSKNDCSFEDSYSDTFKNYTENVDFLISIWLPTCHGLRRALLRP